MQGEGRRVIPSLLRMFKAGCLLAGGDAGAEELKLGVSLSPSICDLGILGPSWFHLGGRRGWNKVERRERLLRERRGCSGKEKSRKGRGHVEREGSRDALSTWREAFQVRTKGPGRPGSGFPPSHGHA